jgi:hypothetical protein
VTSCFRGETLGLLQLNCALLILMFGVVLATRSQNILYSKNLIKINKIYFIFTFTPLFLSKKINQKAQRFLPFAPRSLTVTTQQVGKPGLRCLLYTIRGTVRLCVRRCEKRSLRRSNPKAVKLV